VNDVTATSHNSDPQLVCHFMVSSVLRIFITDPIYILAHFLRLMYYVIKLLNLKYLLAPICAFHVYAVVYEVVIPHFY
jgi:hypothetical protein